MKICMIKDCGKVSSRQGLCQMHAWRLRIHGDPMYERPPRAKCSIETCNRTVKGHGLCQLHLKRKKNGLPFDYVRPKLQSKRYLLRKMLGHPLADRRGRVYVHRAVLFASIGYLIVPCFWCGRRLSWLFKNLLPDHLNHDRHDNRIENLVPSCNSCNAGRTSANPRIRKSVYENFVPEPAYGAL